MTQDKQAQAAASEQQTRRKIIKGLAGVPAVLTLSNGAQGANLSALECITDPDRYHPPVSNNTPEADPIYDCLPDGVVLAPGETAIYHTDDFGAIRRLKETGPGAGEYCVVYVNADGTPVTGDEFLGGEGAHAVTASCYTSFTVA